MSDLRFIGRNGDQIDLADNAGNSYSLRLTDALRGAVTERRLEPVAEPNVRFSIREIQSRLRAGEEFEEVSRISGLSMERIERYASPILQERAWIIEQAEKASPKGSPISLRDLVISRLAPRGINLNQISWNTWRLDDGSWHLVLTYPTAEGDRAAIWNFDSNKRVLVAQDDGARWMGGEEITRQSVKSDPIANHGLLFPLEGEAPQPPRLVAVRTDPSEDELPQLSDIPTDAKKDGVTRRISIPSWDDIMFGRSKKKEDGKD
jgi:hypothetical protein